MKMPWADQTGLAKAAAILGCIFSISLGLCGLNATVFFTFKLPISGGGNGPRVDAANWLVMLGMLEVTVIVLSGIALLAVFVAIVMQEFLASFRK